MIWLLCGALVAGVGVHAWMTWRLMSMQDRLVEARGRAEYAEERADQLLSGGRFVRAYEAKTGTSIYTFKPPARQMTRITMDAAAPAQDDFVTVMLDWIDEVVNDFEITEEVADHPGPARRPASSRVASPARP